MSTRIKEISNFFHYASNFNSIILVVRHKVQIFFVLKFCGVNNVSPLR